MAYRAFEVVRIPVHAGPAQKGDIWCVQAKGNRELVNSGESPAFARLNGNNSKMECQRLCDLLNEAWDEYYGS